MAKDKQPKKQKQQGEDGADQRVALAAHPRARASIRRWRGRAGLFGLIVVSLLSLRAGVPEFDAVMRGLVAGIAAQFVAWAVGVLVWRHLVLSELSLHRDAQRAAAEARRAAAELAAERRAEAHAAARG